MALRRARVYSANHRQLCFHNARIALWLCCYSCRMEKDNEMTIPIDQWLDVEELPESYRNIFSDKGVAPSDIRVSFAVQDNFTVAIVESDGLVIGVTKRHCRHDPRPWPDMARKIALGRAVDRAIEMDIVEKVNESAEPVNGKVELHHTPEEILGFTPGPNASADAVPVIT